VKKEKEGKREKRRGLSNRRREREETEIIIKKFKN
jgi:hypothetical protein